MTGFILMKNQVLIDDYEIYYDINPNKNVNLEYQLKRKSRKQNILK
jgi:hypothetical protein